MKHTINALILMQVCACINPLLHTHTRTHAARHRLYTSCASHLSSGHQPNRAPPNQCFLWALLQMDAQNKSELFFSTLSGWMDGVNLWWRFSKFTASNGEESCYSQSGPVLRTWQNAVRTCRTLHIDVLPSPSEHLGYNAGMHLHY